MTANPHLKAYLENYLALPNPGFAIMINAPWGAGKSHAIKPYKASKDVLYVSLFGAKKTEDIDRAILLERLPLLDNAWTKGLGSVAGTALEYMKFDLKPESFAQIGLPSTLIFDDLERTSLTIPELFGHLNGFVEHQGKRVIVLANEEELQGKHPDYAKYKEKLVGRTLRINADVAAAFPAFLEEITDPASKAALTTNQVRILEVFTLSTFENLRLLRHAMLEFTQLYAGLDEGMRAKGASVSDLIATYFAVHMEYGKGKLSLQDLTERAGWARAMRSVSNAKGEVSKSVMELAAEKYEPAQLDIYEGDVLPNDVCIDLIANGHADQALIRTALKNTSGFADQKNEEAWRTLYWWRHRDEEQFNAALHLVQTDLANLTVTNPHILMHIFGSFLGLAKDDGPLSKDAAKVMLDAKAYIDRLQANGTLPPWGKGSGRGELIDSDAYDGLGYSNRDEPEFHDILDHLKSAASTAFKKQTETVASQLLARIPDELNYVIEVLTCRTDGLRGSGYLTAPILTHLDAPNCAKVFVDQKTDVTYALFKALDQRASNQTGRFPDQDIRDLERDWLSVFWAEIEKFADKASAFRKAQLKTYVRDYKANEAKRLPPSRRS
ncbi:P-loop NTPase fold protein [Pseudorhodobacter ferrugineus]|uniref:P-loop NTPase fold protein n=1 Tax=Pseudorhodobacter ferrugineus TaxID=77008 RepID=UPI0003B5A9C6|nr:P-loop NTPase fold protein [Pseudorhodobacter ferrugineus]